MAGKEKITMKLKNGVEESEALVAVTMYSLRKLGALEFYEIVALCRNPEHVLFGTIGKKLQRLNLIEDSGHVHGSIRNIVLSAAIGEGLSLRLGNPRAEQ